MDETLYDEFGNYIGPDIPEDEDDAAEEEIELGEEGGGVPIDTHPGPEAVGPGALASARDAFEDAEGDRRVVLFEDKQYYPEASEVYGDAETLIQEEDTQPITEPIVAPVRTKKFDCLETTPPRTTFAFEFLAGLMYKRELIRNVCLLGHLHHGKTSLLDVLINATHDFVADNITTKGGQFSKAAVANAHLQSRLAHKRKRFTDYRKDEQDRGLSIKATPISFVLPTSQDKSYLINIFDTPGHVNFHDEAAAAIRLCDGALIVVDALEGVMVGTEILLNFALQEQVDIALVITGIDKLILELRLPPQDAYHKLRHTIEEVNTLIGKHCRLVGRKAFKLSPAKGNVAFASGLYQFVFTLQTFAKMYIETFGSDPQSKTKGPSLCRPDILADCLWGDIWFDSETRKFSRHQGNASDRSFVEFILTPLYKLTAHVIGEEREGLEPIVNSLGIHLRADDYLMSTKELLKKVCGAFFGPPTSLIDIIVATVPNPLESAERKTRHTYTGAMSDDVGEAMRRCDPEGPLMVHTSKNYHRPDCSSFDLFGRVMSGTLCKGQRVRILGEAFSLDDDEDQAEREITALWIFQGGRYRVEVSHVPAGNWALIGGCDASVVKTSTITSLDPELRDSVQIFRPLKFPTISVVKVACEALNPSELPKMLEGLRKIDKSYPLAKTRVEESGEHVLISTGELALDCILHDLRNLYGDLEIKVADPVATFCETVMEHSSMRCYSTTPNGKNHLYMTADVLDPGLANDLDKGILRAGDWSKEDLADYFKTAHNWDALTAASVWAFGPDEQSPNMLLDETLPSEVDSRKVHLVKDSIIQGFRWAAREGPLIEEPMRNVKFKLTNCVVADEPVARGAGQIIPTARRVAYSSFLLATPRLLEPMLFSEIVCPADCVAAIYTVLSRRRGRILRDVPKPGTPVFIVQALLPAMECFGFETDLRCHTSGQAFCLSLFHSWEVVPGDPMDRSIVLRPLEPAPHQHLAREFLVKTRRRKGLSDEVTVHKFFDPAMLAELKERDEAADFENYI